MHGKHTTCYIIGKVYATVCVKCTYLVHTLYILRYVLRKIGMTINGYLLFFVVDYVKAVDLRKGAYYSHTRT